MTTVGYARSLSTRTRLHITARGRRVLAAVIAAPVAAAIAVAVLGGGSALASRNTGAPAGSFATVTVTAGESLWGIAQRVAPGADPRDVVDEIIRLNALPDALVHPGQQLAIPPMSSR